MNTNSEKDTKNVSFSLNGIYCEILSDCNLRCKHCYNASGMNNNILSKSTIENVFNEMKTTNCTNFVLSGGEPFLHPEIWDILDLLCTEDFSITLVTNGTLINEFIVDKISKYNINLLVSLNGSSAENDDLIRGKGSFDKTIKGLYLLKAQNQLHKVTINFVLTKINSNDISEMVNLLEKIGVKKISFILMTKSGRGKDNFDILSLTDEEKKLILDKLLNIKNTNPQLEIKIPEVTQGCPLTSINSPEINVNIRITPEGNVFACQLFESKNELSIGNIYRHSVSDILKGNKLHELRNFMISMFKYNTHCNGCIWKLECQKGCPAVFLANGALDDTDGLCSFRKHLFTNKK